MLKNKLLLLLLIITNVYCQYKLSGKVINVESQKFIPNANIFIREIGEGTVSNPYGYFEIDISKGKYTLETSVIGFKTDIQEFIIDNDNIELEIGLHATILEFNEIQVEGLFSSRLGYESVEIIDNDIINSMDKESISDLLRIIPSVNVQFAHPNGRNVNLSIRGSSDYKPGGYNNRVLILLDGFPILIPNSGSPDWNSLPLESIHHIEINNSPASSQYGHNSMGGVINLITVDNKIENNTNLRISGGTHNTGQTSLTHKQNNGNWSYGVNAMARLSSGHRFNADNQIIRFRTYLQYADLKGRTYRLNHMLSYSDIGHPGFDIDTLISYRKSERLSQYLQGNIFYPIGNGLSMSHSIFLNKFDTNYYDRNDTPENEKEGNSKYLDLTFGIRSEMLLTKWARWILMTGVDLDWSHSKVSVFNPIYDIPTQFSFGSFLQSKYSIGYGWSLGTGLRYDYRKSNPGDNFPKRTYTNLSKKMNLIYTMKRKRAFTLAYSEGFRAPSLSELYLLHTSTYGLTVQGNPNLSAEKVQNIELVYEHPHSNILYWSLSVFFNKYENLIDFVYGLPTKAVNREGVTGIGGEYQFSWDPIKLLGFSGSYTYLDMSDKRGDPILYRSKHRGQLYINFQHKIINIKIGVQGWSKQKYEDFLSHNYQIIDNKTIFPIKKLPERIIHTLIISRKFSNYFSGSIHIFNLFDTKYELIQDFSMPGRTWQFKLTKTITKE